MERQEVRHPYRPHAHKRNLTTFQLTRLFHADRPAALIKALELNQRPELPLALRARCCMLLATGETDYVQYAKEAVEHYTEILAAAPDNEIMKRSLRNAESVLVRAERDDAARVAAIAARKAKKEAAKAAKQNEEATVADSTEGEASGRKNEEGG
jgi:hypothetical protein